MKIRKDRVRVGSNGSPDFERPPSYATRYRVGQLHRGQECAGMLMFTDEFMEHGTGARSIVANSIRELRADIRRKVAEAA